MKITAIVYDYDHGTTISTTEINSGHLGVIDYFVKSLYPEEQGLCIKVDKTQINVEHEFVGYFTQYTVTIEDKELDIPCVKLDFETATEVNDFLHEYLGNVIETANAMQAWT